MSLLQRSTRSAPDPVLQSLPKKSRKPRVVGAAPAAHSPGPTRPRWKPSGGKSGNDNSVSEDELPNPTKTLAAATAADESDFEVEVLFPRRKKRAPLPAKRDVVVSPNTKDKLRRLSAGASVLGASMGKTTPRKSSSPKKTFSVAIRKPSRDLGADTQDVVVVATPHAGLKRVRAGSIDSSDFEDENITPLAPGRQHFRSLPDTQRDRGQTNRPKAQTLAKRVVKALEKNINAHNAANPASAVKDSAPRRKKAKMKSVGENSTHEGAHMDKLMMAAIRDPSTPGNESLNHALNAVEDLEGAAQKAIDAQARQTLAKRMKKKEKQKKIRKRVEKENAQEEESGRGEYSGGKGAGKRHAKTSARRGGPAPNGYANLPNVTADTWRHSYDDSSSDEDDNDLAHCLDLIQKMADKYGSTSTTFDILSKDFCDLKVLQTPPPNGEPGYYGLIGKLTVPLLANTGARISTHEYATLGKLTEIMHSLAEFHLSAKKFENKLRRLVRMNLTQLRNIEKAQRAIKNVFDARRYEGDGTIWRVGAVWAGEDPTQEIAREANREAVRKRNEEIERVLVQREMAMYGYQTPESVEGHQGKGCRVRSVGETEGRDRRRIGADEESQSTDEESNDDGDIHVDSEGSDEDHDQSIRVGEGAGSEEEEEEEADEGQPDEDQTDEDQTDEDQTDEHNHSDGVESEGGQGTRADEKSRYGRGNYGYPSFEQQVVGSSEGREGSLIVIGDDVEVVHVEGFGERVAKERARVEREARRVNGESDDEVSVLEDSEWTEEEVDALLFGIEAYQGKFDKIKNSPNYREQLRNRSVEAVAEKARDIKRDFIESGRANVLGHCWDGV